MAHSRSSQVVRSFGRGTAGRATLMVGVVILTVVGWIINRTLGVPVPLWSAKE